MVSDSIRLATPEELIQFGYNAEQAATAVVCAPATPRALHSEDLVRWQADATTPDGLTVELVQLPQADVMRLGNAAINLAQQEHFAPGKGPLMELAPSVFGEFIELTDSQGYNLLTTRADPRISHYSKGQPVDTPYDWLHILPGMHVDNWARLPNYRRVAESPRRLGMVLYGQRWILLAQPDITTISKALYLHNNGQDASAIGYAENVPRLRDIRQYVHEGIGKISCLWVRLGAGEAYIAGTELIVHDGSTFGQNQSRIAFWFYHAPYGVLPQLGAQSDPAPSDLLIFAKPPTHVVDRYESHVDDHDYTLYNVGPDPQPISLAPVSIEDVDAMTALLRKSNITTYDEHVPQDKMAAYTDHTWQYRKRQTYGKNIQVQGTGSKERPLVWGAYYAHNTADSKLIGMCRAVNIPGSPDILLTTLDVDESYRNHYIGTALLAKAIGHQMPYAGDPSGDLYAHVVVGTKAEVFYTKYGFTPTGRDMSEESPNIDGDSLPLREWILKREDRRRILNNIRATTPPTAIAPRSKPSEYASSAEYWEAYDAAQGARSRRAPILISAAASINALSKYAIDRHKKSSPSQQLSSH